MRNTKAIFIKQIRSLIKSPAMLVQGVIFAVMVLVLSFLTAGERYCEVYCIPAYICAYCLENNPLHSLPTPSITGMMTVMFVGMAMMSSAAALVQEDKTSNNLRFMTMAGMKPSQYLPGTAAALFIVSLPVLVLFGLVGRHFGVATLEFLAVTGAGAMVSIILGIAIGLSKAPVLAAPASMIFGMGPMFSSFNESLARWLHFTYTQQVNLGVYNLEELGLQSRTFAIIGINAAVILLAFVWMHRKGELRW